MAAPPTGPAGNTGAGPGLGLFANMFQQTSGAGCSSAAFGTPDLPPFGGASALLPPMRLRGTYHRLIPGDPSDARFQNFELRMQPGADVYGRAEHKVVYTNFDNVTHPAHGRWSYFRQALRIHFDYDGREDRLKLAWLDATHPSQNEFFAFRGLDWQSRVIEISFKHCEILSAPSANVGLLRQWIAYPGGVRFFFPDLTRGSLYDHLGGAAAASFDAARTYEGGSNKRARP